MARRKDSPQKAAIREMMRDYMKNNDISIKDGTDVNSIMRDMMSVLLEGALDEELDEELGYSKYDYRNKETDNITYTSNLLANGAPPKDVQELLEHSAVSTTMNIYAHATREAKKNSARLLDRVVGND